MMTYREEIQEMISDLQKIHDRAGRLRDKSGYGLNEGKKHLNHLRNNLPLVWQTLQELDNEMPDWLAAQETSKKKYNSDDHE